MGRLLAVAGWLWALLMCLGPAAALPLGPAGALLIVQDEQDPLSQQLWRGNLAAVRRHAPESVAVYVVSREPSSSPSSLSDHPPGVLRATWSDLLPHWQEALVQRGHEVREVQVEGVALAPLVGLGDGGMGRRVLADEPRWPVVVYGHDACSDAPPAHEVKDRAVLIRRGGCPYVDKVLRARRHGAQAVLFINNDLALNRVGGQCAECADVALAVVPKAPGEALWEAAEAALVRGAPLSLRWRSRTAWPLALRVQADGQVAEVGMVPYPFNHLLNEKLDPFEALGLEAQHMAFEAARERRLQEEARSGRLRVLPVMQGLRVADPHWKGERTRVVTAVDPTWVMNAQSLAWDLALSCEGDGKVQCPPWDYIVQMSLCRQVQQERCDWEAGRWITPYWSGGRWVHDVSPLLGLMREALRHAPRDAQGRALLAWEFHSIQPYLVTAALRFMQVAPDEDGRQPWRPVASQVLAWPGGGMTDGRYGQRQPEQVLQVPAGVERVTLAVLVSGHGFADAQKCAEFCDTVHEFSVAGGGVHRLSQPEAGSERGCLHQVAQGVVPNQGGTWVYGRNGWCPGDAVQFRHVDISADVAQARRRMVGRRASGRGAALPPVSLRLRYRSTVGGVDHHPPAAGADGRAPDARLDVTVMAVFHEKEARRETPRRRAVAP